MSTYCYKLENVRESDRNFFVDMLSYISECITDIKCLSDAVEIEYEGTDEAHIRESMEKLVDMINVKLSKMDDKVAVKTLEDHTECSTINIDDVFEEMLDKGIVREISSGAYAYSGIFLKVFKYFSKKIEEQMDIIFPEYEKIEMEVPTLTPIADYNEGKYFESFPHHIMFQTTMKNDIDVIDEFSKNGIQDESFFTNIRPPKNVMRTAACVPVYPSLRGKRIAGAEPKCVLVSGKCFRNEGINVTELSRLNEFYMKEYVFIGTPDQAKSCIERACALWSFWADKFKLNCKIETANDSFFASNYKKLQLFQLIGDSKREFKWLVPGSKNYISCSSANFHRTHFTKVYDIKTKESGAYCHTSCFAFGIERLAYALLSQKGLDTSKWDKETYEEINKYCRL